VLTHHESGAPVLEHKSYKEISISHSQGYFALYLAYEEAVGVDVEEKRIIHRDGFKYFLNENEIKQSWSDSELLSIWCAKEAYYKLKKGELADLRLDATITGVLDGIITVKTVDDSLAFYIVEDNNYTLVYS
jgi:phosphopantetheinyl transferase